VCSLTEQRARQAEQRAAAAEAALVDAVEKRHAAERHRDDLTVDWTAPLTTEPSVTSSSALTKSKSPATATPTATTRTKSRRRSAKSKNKKK